MKWVTRDFVHLDRVATPWLIKRFVDHEAEFVFVPWGEEDQRPDDAIPLALPGAELGPHDEKGTTFRKVMTKYDLRDPALEAIAKVIHCGVDYVLHDFRPATDDVHGQVAVGLLNIAEGFLVIHRTDGDILAASFPLYDALYANFTVHHLIETKGVALPPHAGKGPTAPTMFLRKIFDERN
jgi:hypothetical protein